MDIQLKLGGCIFIQPIDITDLTGVLLHDGDLIKTKLLVS